MPDKKTYLAVPFWILILSLATTVVGVADHGLWTPDEPRAADLVASLSRPGATLLYPMLGGKPFVEKPPLYFWLGTGTLRLLGPTLGREGAIRAASALCALAGALLAWLVVRRFLDGGGKTAAATLLTTIAYVHSGHWIIADPALVLFVSGAVLLAALGEEEENPVAILAAFACLGLSFLAKGLIGPVLVAPAWGAVFWIYRRNIRRHLFLHLAGAGLALAVILAWVVPFKLTAPPESWHHWFWNNQVGRFLGKTPELGHLRGPFYYLPSLPVMLLPWTPVLLGILSGRRWRELGDDHRARRLLGICTAWAAGGLLLLSASGTKRGIYLYPLLPAFAILAAGFSARQPRWADWCLRGLSWILVAVLALTGLLAVTWENEALAWRVGLDIPALAAAAAGALILLRARLSSFTTAAAVTAVFVIGAGISILPRVDAAKNYREETVRFLGAVGDGEDICAWDLDETSRGLLGFYGNGLILPDLHDEAQPEERLGILTETLTGRNPRCRFLVAMEKRESFPPEGIKLEKKNIRAVAKLGQRRRLFLIECHEPNQKGDESR